MKANEVKVERLEIRLKGTDAGSARDLGNSIGAKVLEQIARQANIGNQGRSIRIAHLDAGTVQLGDGAMASAGSAIANQIGATVKGKLASGAKGMR
jgi:hypothetical protein